MRRTLRHVDALANRRRGTRLVALFALAVVAVALAGCGGSSKPSYCSAVSSLESSIKAVPTTDVVQNGLSSLQSAVTKVENDAKAVLDSAKSDFPNETNALKSSINSLTSSVKQLTSSPSVSQVASLAANVGAVVTAANNFKSATSSKC